MGIDSSAYLAYGWKLDRDEGGPWYEDDEESGEYGIEVMLRGGSKLLGYLQLGHYEDPDGPTFILTIRERATISADAWDPAEIELLPPGIGYKERAFAEQEAVERGFPRDLVEQHPRWWMGVSIG